MLTIKDLQCKVEEKSILKGLNLQINPGEVHAIMGPNGTGKSTLSHMLAGKSGYDLTEGTVTFDGQDLMEMSIDERAKAGLFLAFQYPVEIPGVSSMNFLKSSVNAIHAAQGLPELDGAQFLRSVREVAGTLNIDDAMLRRAVNQGFSGGEKKRFEVLQMKMLKPKLAVLDETDSGLDIDALKMICESINDMRAKDRSFLIITHYQRLLNYVTPDHVHIMHDGRIIYSGGPEVAEKLESEGYEAFRHYADAESQ